MICWLNAGLLLGQRRRRWTNSKLTLGQRLMFAGKTNFMQLLYIHSKHCEFVIFSDLICALIGV